MWTGKSTAVLCWPVASRSTQRTSPPGAGTGTVTVAPDAGKLVATPPWEQRTAVTVGPPPGIPRTTLCAAVYQRVGSGAETVTGAGTGTVTVAVWVTWAVTPAPEVMVQSRVWLPLPLTATARCGVLELCAGPPSTEHDSAAMPDRGVGSEPSSVTCSPVGVALVDHAAVGVCLSILTVWVSAAVSAPLVAVA